MFVNIRMYEEQIIRIEFNRKLVIHAQIPIFVEEKPEQPLSGPTFGDRPQYPLFHSGDLSLPRGISFAVDVHCESGPFPAQKQPHGLHDAGDELRHVDVVLFHVIDDPVVAVGPAEVPTLVLAVIPGPTHSEGLTHVLKLLPVVGDEAALAVVVGQHGAAFVVEALEVVEAEHLRVLNGREIPNDDRLESGFVFLEQFLGEFIRRKTEHVFDAFAHGTVLQFSVVIEIA